MVTISVKDETQEKLKDIGKKGETYDTIIQRLIKVSERSEKGDKREG
jgi:predicted CopG family antitoxin